jgi:hypothetical protein
MWAFPPFLTDMRLLGYARWLLVLVGVVAKMGSLRLWVFWFWKPPAGQVENGDQTIVRNSGRGNVKGEIGGQ